MIPLLLLALALAAWKAGELIDSGVHRLLTWRRNRQRQALDRLRLPRARHLIRR